MCYCILYFVFFYNVDLLIMKGVNDIDIIMLLLCMNVFIIIKIYYNFLLCLILIIKCIELLFCCNILYIK